MIGSERLLTLCEFHTMLDIISDKWWIWACNMDIYFDSMGNVGFCLGPLRSLWTVCYQGHLPKVDYAFDKKQLRRYC